MNSSLKTLSNFKNRKSNGGGAGFKAQTLSSGEGGDSQNSDLIESVQLNCSEHLDNSFKAGGPPQIEEGELINLIDKLPNNNDEDGPLDCSKINLSPPEKQK